MTTTITTRLWGESYPREGIFDIVKAIAPYRSWDDRDYYITLSQSVGNVARWILENQNGKLYHELLQTIAKSVSWLRDRGYAQDVALGMINQERLRQQTKWGLEQDHLNERFYCILGEEFGEIADAMCSGDTNNLTDEIVQTAAVATCWLEFRLIEDVL